MASDCDAAECTSTTLRLFSNHFDKEKIIIDGYTSGNPCLEQLEKLLVKGRSKRYMASLNSACFPKSLLLGVGHCQVYGVRLGAVLLHIIKDSNEMDEI